MSYQPNPFSGVLSNLQVYLQQEFSRFEAYVRDSNDKIVQIQTSYYAPTKPRNGMTVLADGTKWDPGSGAGVYTYYGGSWHKLG